MKVIYVDSSASGHHLKYLLTLSSNKSYESTLVVPNNVDIKNREVISYSTILSKKRTFFNYLKWLIEVKRIIKSKNPDIVHFVYGDLFYRYFGIGFGLFKKYKTVVTFHWARSGFLQRISTKIICRKISTTVVHSDYIKNMFENCGITNAVHIEYPQFNNRFKDKNYALKVLELSPETPVISCVGNTRADKGLDLLLSALNSVEIPFQLLIAGKAEAFDEQYIKSVSEKYSEKVKLMLHYLSEDELTNVLNASDIIVLPYRRVFNGASGPLTEGVWLKKCIVGPNHGNLGDIITTYHLGYTFETENVTSLSQAILTALSNNFQPDEKYLNYRQNLNIEVFKTSYKSLYNSLINK